MPSSDREEKPPPPWAVTRARELYAIGYGRTPEAYIQLLARAVAADREAARGEERDAIVSWLRADIAGARAYAETPECGPNRRVTLDIAGAYEMCAEDIERGKHIHCPERDTAPTGAPNANE